MTNKLNIGILGADGRMGQAVAGLLAGHPKAVLSAALTAPDSSHLGRAVAGHDLAYIDAIADGLAACDVLIDFSAPAAILKAVQIAPSTRCGAIVSGTTGLTDAQEADLKTAAKETALLRSGNFSLGVNLLEILIEQAAKALNKGWDIDVLEMHHRHKIDAPSGTAFMLGEAAAKGRGVKLSDVQAVDRNGARREGDIGFAALRGGDVVGMHEVRIASEMEMITLAHQAFDRSVFASGAIEAALWAAAQKPGLYNMRDMLAL